MKQNLMFGAKRLVCRFIVFDGLAQEQKEEYDGHIVRIK